MAGRLKLGQILVNRGILDPDQLAAALAAQQEGGARLGMLLVRMGFVDEETLIRTLAGQLKLPVARIRGKRVSPDVLDCLPVDLAEKHRCLPLFLKQEGGGRVLFVAMEDPSDADALDALARASGEQLRAVLVGPTELEEALQRHYHWASLTGEAPAWQTASSPGDATAGGDPEPAEDDPDLGRDLELDTDDEDDPLAAALLPDPASAGELGEADTTPELPESELDEDPFERADPGLEAADPAQRELALAEPVPPGADAPRPESLDPRIILRALSQLLVEKGVIGRDEFVQRLGELAAREAGRG